MSGGKPGTGRAKKRPNIKKVPGPEDRQRISNLVFELHKDRYPVGGFSRGTLEVEGRKVLGRLDLPEKYLGFTMVQINNAAGLKRYATVPFEKRLFLLPKCLQDSKVCPGTLDKIQLHCLPGCDLACHIKDLKEKAMKMGYKTLVAEGTPVVMKILVKENLHCILGISCLDVLDKVFMRIATSRIPNYAVPLLRKGCKYTQVDLEVVEWAMGLRVEGENGSVPARDHLMPALFEEVLEALPEPANPIERIGHDFIVHGGKRLRPFMTISTYSSLTNAKSLRPHVKRVALAMEVFHKASLVHDDIEDHQEERYGRPTIYAEHGLETAVNEGDYLMGLGYRLITEAGETLSQERFRRVMEEVTAAHLALVAGQGLEILGRTDRDIPSVNEVLDIYALKTSAAFRCALMCGAILGGYKGKGVDLDGYAKHLGISFQILDDICDILDLGENAEDVIEGGPNILVSIAASTTKKDLKKDLIRIWRSKRRTLAQRKRIVTVLRETNALSKAYMLALKHHNGALSCIQGLRREDLKDILVEIANYIFEKKRGGRP